MARILPGTLPVGVVLVHDITGLDPTNLSFAKRLNDAGFHVAAVDLFDGRTAATLPEGMHLRSGLTSDRIRNELAAAYHELRGLAPDAAIGVMGFCMGGGAALEGACATRFAFCVDWYGMMQDVDAVKGLAGPLLLILASEDDRINPWVYGQLLPKLDEHRKRVQVELYPAVVHPFHRPDWETVPMPGGKKSYDRAASEDAWRKAVEFMREAAGH